MRENYKGLYNICFDFLLLLELVILLFFILSETFFVDPQRFVRL